MSHGPNQLPTDESAAEDSHEPAARLEDAGNEIPDRSTDPADLPEVDMDRPLRVAFGKKLRYARTLTVLVRCRRQRDGTLHAISLPKVGLKTATEEIADYLQINCHRFNTALGRQKGTNCPLSALLYTAHPPQFTQLRPPEGWASFSGRRAGHLQRNHRRTDGPRGPARLRQGPRSVPQRGALLARPLPVTPAGTGGITRPGTQEAKKAKTSQGARQRARQQGAAPRPGPGPSDAAPPHSETPGYHLQHRPHQRPPPPP